MPLFLIPTPRRGGVYLPPNAVNTCPPLGGVGVTVGDGRGVPYSNPPSPRPSLSHLSSYRAVRRRHSVGARRVYLPPNAVRPPKAYPPAEGRLCHRRWWGGFSYYESAPRGFLPPPPASSFLSPSPLAGRGTQGEGQHLPTLRIYPLPLIPSRRRRRVYLF